MAKNIFEIVKVSEEQVVLKVNAKDNLTVAMNPFVRSDYDYITVTRGEDHTLTVIETDGTTFNFSWGRGGYTLISDNLNRLKKEVINFIENKSHVLLGWDDRKPEEISIFYNNNFHLWQLTLRGSKRDSRGSNYLSAHYWSNTATTAEEMMEEAKDFVPVKIWVKEIAETGIDVWKAKR